MKVHIFVYGADEYEKDTLTSRMVDARLKTLQEEFEINGVETTITRKD